MKKMVKNYFRTLYEYFWEDLHFFRRWKWKSLYSEIKADLENGKLILDLGCGKGVIVRKLSKNFMMVGVDKSKNDIKTAVKYNKKNNSSFIIGDAESLPFKKNVFDAAISFSVLEHIKDDLQALKEIWVSLKENGMIFKTLDNFFLSEDLAKKHKCHRFYNRSLIKKKLTKTRFKLLKSKYILTSKISHIFGEFHCKVGLSGIPLLFFLITYPISLLAEKVFYNTTQGLILVIKAKKGF